VTAKLPVARQKYPESDILREEPFLENRKLGIFEVILN
jgi:hypothetical protein